MLEEADSPTVAATGAELRENQRTQREQKRLDRQRLKEGRSNETKGEAPLLDPAIPQHVAAITQLLADRLGQRPTHVRVDPIVRKKSPEHLSKYFKHTFSLGGSDPDLVIFVKTAVMKPERVARREPFLSSLGLREFRTPKFYGLIDLTGGIHDPQREDSLGVWEFVSGRTIAFPNCPRPELFRVVNAVAAINSQTEEARRELPGLPVGVRILKPIAESIRSAIDDFDKRAVDTREMARQAAILERVEPGVLSDLDDAKHDLFSHMDLSPPNIFFTPADEPLVIIDWDSCCIAPAGCSLRNLAVLDDEMQEELVEFYVDAMAKRNIRLRSKNVLFAMRATQVYSTLTWGARRSAWGKPGRWLPANEQWQQRLDARAEAQVRWGLERLHYLDRPA